MGNRRDLDRFGFLAVHTLAIPAVAFLAPSYFVVGIAHPP